MINITSELQILNQEHWESDFDHIEWAGIDFIYLSKPSYFVSGKCFNMLELYMQILIIPSLLQLMILLMNLRRRHDITMILRCLCTLSTQSSLKRTPTLVWVASHQKHYNTWLKNLNINTLLVPSLGTSVRTFGFPFITYKNVSIILLPFIHYNFIMKDTQILSDSYIMTSTCFHHLQVQHVQITP